MKILSRHKTLLSDLGLLYAAVIWGGTFIIVKDSLETIDPVTLVGYRFLLAASILAVFLRPKGIPLFSNLKTGLTLGFFLWLLYIPQTIGLRYTTASNSGFITGLFIVFVPILNYLFFRQIPNLIKIISVGLALCGLWYLTGGLAEINLGDAITLISAGTYAVHILLADKYIKAEINPYVLSFQQFLVTGVLSCLASIIFGLPLGVNGISGVMTILFLSLFPTLSAFVIQLIAQQHTAPLKVALIFTMEPVFAALFAWTLGGEVFIPQRAFGGMLIVAGMMVSELSVDKVKLLLRQQQRTRVESK